MGNKILSWIKNKPIENGNEVYLLVDPITDLDLSSFKIPAPLFHTALQIKNSVITYNEKGPHFVPAMVSKLLSKIKANLNFIKKLN